MALIGLLLWFAQGGGSCAGCSVVGKEVELCEAHAAEERIVLAREGKRVRSSNEAEVLAGLEAIAALTLAHPGAPSPRVVAALAAGLNSRKSPKVRVHTVELLGPPQHASASLEALLDAFAQVDEDIGGIPDEESAKLLRQALALGELTVDLLEQTGLARNDRQKFKKAKNAAEDLREKLAKATPLLEVRSAILRCLAGFPDDRVVQAIQRSSAARSLESTEALLLLGSRPAVEHVLENLKGWQDRSSWHGKDDVERHEARGRRLQESLKGLATRRGLLPCPEVGEKPYDAWMEWWRSNGSSFSARLPGVTSALLDSGATKPVSPR